MTICPLSDDGQCSHPHAALVDGHHGTGDEVALAQGNWQPRTYPEMTLPLGQPLEAATQISTSVYRRAFENAVAYVNLSDASASINLPTTSPHKNSLGQVVSSPLVLASFTGLTLYP